jgi:hypothetical protein
MENHLTLTTMIRQFLNSLLTNHTRLEIEGIRLLKVYSALDAIQTATINTEELLRNGLGNIDDVGEDWFHALNRSEEAVEGLIFGNTLTEANSMVAEMAQSSGTQRSDVLKHLAKVQRQVDEMYAGFGYVMN